MQKTINHHLGKTQAIKLVKKAISGKFAIMKDAGDTLKVGAPMMTATIVITDTTIDVSGGGPAGPVASTCASEIEMAVQEAEENQAGQPAQQAQAAPAQAPASAPAPRMNPDSYLEYQTKAIALLKQYKELYDNEVLTKEEFEAKKADILNFINGMTPHK